MPANLRKNVLTLVCAWHPQETTQTPAVNWCEGRERATWPDLVKSQRFYKDLSFSSERHGKVMSRTLTCSDLYMKSILQGTLWKIRQERESGRSRQTSEWQVLIIQARDGRSSRGMWIIFRFPTIKLKYYKSSKMVENQNAAKITGDIKKLLVGVVKSRYLSSTSSTSQLPVFQLQGIQRHLLSSISTCTHMNIHKQWTYVHIYEFKK